ncbi:hypothetical protein A4V04_00525 [Burkholderiales bacterium YL45]|uniref:Uncharacterized protein n=1 Tax=Turicimonas muris TaxID=1796652 RepID=A0A227KS65_9BURK|nr:hypothetical protein [Turicimonas muris]ANU65063.1 hypothetical protein A4V04_00525 [Burkholderiales bacterium YL45]OXE50865.1 hypothetical protein ADH67_00755 [Turicimonas muris]QQQ96225.1 hypothetical protein I5Q81_09685 [Turicimonas muris]
MPRKQTTKQTVQTAKVIATSFEENKKAKNSATSGETVVIACSLPHGLKFDDVPTANGGTKTVIFPGLNDHLKGAKEGILLGRGNSVAVVINKDDWLNILRMHGQERVFKGVNGSLPCLMEMKSEDEYKSRQSQGELEELDNGLHPVDPESVGVAEVTQEV